jgi:hypothetical protein
MAAYQLNLFICEICGKMKSHIKEVSLYSDPMVDPLFDNPDGNDWEYTGEFPNEKLTCPECMKKVK